MTTKTKLSLIAVGTVILSGLAATLIPMPYGPIVALLMAFGGGLWMKSFFDILK